MRQALHIGPGSKKKGPAKNIFRLGLWPAPVTDELRFATARTLCTDVCIDVRTGVHTDMRALWTDVDCSTALVETGKTRSGLAIDPCH